MFIILLASPGVNAWARENLIPSALLLALCLSALLFALLVDQFGRIKNSVELIQVVGKALSAR
jgi:4-amino-4-deoxy-L-arabinose transferase-like glycosyltransferase